MPQMLTNELSLNPKCAVLVKGYIHLWENSVKKKLCKQSAWECYVVVNFAYFFHSPLALSLSS